MILIWRSWGWLILPFFLLTWFVAASVIAPIYSAATGYGSLYNADRGITWAIAFFVVAALILVFVRYALPRLELIPTTAQQREAPQARKAAETQLAAAGQQLPARKLISTFFFIPMRAFPIVFAVIGILLLIVNVPVALGEAGPNRLQSADRCEPRPVVAVAGHSLLPHLHWTQPQLRGALAVVHHEGLLGLAVAGGAHDHVHGTLEVPVAAGDHLQG